MRDSQAILICKRWFTNDSWEIASGDLWEIIQKIFCEWIAIDLQEMIHDMVSERLQQTICEQIMTWFVKDSWWMICKWFMRGDLWEIHQKWFVRDLQDDSQDSWEIICQRFCQVLLGAMMTDHDRMWYPRWLKWLLRTLVTRIELPSFVIKIIEIGWNY